MQTFKRLLVNRCLEEFEQERPEASKHPTNLPDARGKDLVNAAEQKHPPVGHLVFIGELYKELMLTDKIMHKRVFRWLLDDLQNPVEAHLEALCALMTTTGKVLDSHPRSKSLMDIYFRRMERLSLNPAINTTIRFRLKVRCHA